MSKQREREIRERLEDLKLKVGQTSGYEVTTGFHLTQAQIERQKNEAEFRELQAEEAAELDAKRKNQPAFKLISQQWSKPVDVLQRTAGMLLPDVAAELPMTTNPIGDMQATFNNFLDLQKSRNVAYSSDGQNRLILYTACASRGNHVIDGVSYHPALDKLDCWIAADRRLVELSAYSENERAELLDEPQPQVVEEPSANELLREANAGWFAMFSATWDAWLKSLAQDPWRFVPDEDQKIAALKMLQQFETTPDSWDRTRRSLGRSGVWPNLVTAHEVLADKVEAGDFRLDTVEGRAAYTRAHNQLTYGTL